MSVYASDPRLLVENFCIVASSTLLWFDFALTFTTEVRRIWGRKFSGATLVYLFTRYTAVIDRVFFVLEVLLWNSSDEVCGGILHTDDVLTILNYFAFSAFTCLRVYGVWGCDWKPLIVVLPLTLVRPILYSITNSHNAAFQGGPPYGCYYVYSLSDQTIATFSTVSKATTIASDAILIALTWIKTFGIKKDSLKLGMRTPLSTMLLRDGTAYFLVLLLIQIVTIIASQEGPELTVWLVWPYFDQTLTVIFLSRFMLDLRGLYFEPSDKADTGETSTVNVHGFSDIRFTTSDVVGNLGATLDPAMSVSSEHSFSTPDADDGPASPYDDEKPKYTSDPFQEGMKFSLALDMNGPRLTAVELQDFEESPVSPQSNMDSSPV